MEGRREGWPAPATDVQIEWIRDVLDRSSKPSNALDPRCGSGQVLYECGLRGWKCTGMESDPFLRWTAMARSFRYRPDAAEFVGYAWERVADDVFWENDMFTVPQVGGTLEFGSVTTDFLRRVRRQIDRESDEGINYLLKVAFCSSLPGMAGDDSSFDDRKGMEVYSDCLQNARTSLDPNPQVGQTVHLCDSRDIPLTLRNVYDLVVSVLPAINERQDSTVMRTMSQWIGFGDMERRDDTSIGYPLGDFSGYMSRAQGVEEIPGIPSVNEGADYLNRWFSDAKATIVSLSKVMSRSCTANLLVPDEVFSGVNIPKAEILAGIASSLGLEAEKVGKGETRSLMFGRAQ